MSELTEEETAARSLGFELLDVSRVYENRLIPREVGVLRRRPFPPYRRAIIGLVGRQRRFLRAAYTLADAGLLLEAIGPLRSMFEFLVCERWLAHDPDRNWKIWMEEDHHSRDIWRERLQQHAPTLHDAATAALSPEQRKEANKIASVREQVRDEVKNRKPGDRHHVEQRAAQVGLSFVYDGLFRYESSAAVHAMMFAVDLLLEPAPNGLMLRSEPTQQFAPVPVYLHGATLLYEALNTSSEHNADLRISDLPEFGRRLRGLAEQQADMRLPNWRELLPDEAFDHPNVR